MNGRPPARQKQPESSQNCLGPASTSRFPVPTGSGGYGPERPGEGTVSTNIKAELAAMEKMTTGELVERYAELTGQPVRTRHLAYLIRRIAWRLEPT